MSKFYGKYRAIVVQTNDPYRMGRIKVQCPSVLGEYASAWCLPCVPFVKDDISVLPRVNETVWVEFEGGNPSKPIYTGTWWGANRCPL